MGLGDAKLFAVIGFWFGWISIPFVIFLSSIIALISITQSLLKKSKRFILRNSFWTLHNNCHVSFTVFKRKTF